MNILFSLQSLSNSDGHPVPTERPSAGPAYFYRVDTNRFAGIMIKGLDWLERHAPQTLRYGKHGAINIIVFRYGHGKIAPF